MAVFSFALAIIGSVFASSECIANESCTSTLVRDEDVDLMGAFSLLQMGTSDPWQQEMERSAWPQQFQATAQAEQSAFSQMPEVGNAAAENQQHQWQKRWRQRQQLQQQQLVSQQQQWQQPQVASQQEQWQQQQPQLAATPEFTKDLHPQASYSSMSLPQPQLAAMPEFTKDPHPQVSHSSMSQTYDDQGRLQQLPLLQLQSRASMQPQVVQPVPLVDSKTTAPASGLWSGIEAAATSKMEGVLALAKSSLAKVGLMRDRLSNTAKQLSEAAQSQQVPRSLQQGLVEQASRSAKDQGRSNHPEQLAKALLVEASQLQQQLQALNDHLAMVATMRNTQPQGADSAVALQIAEDRAARAEAATRTQSESAWAQAERRLQVAARASEESTAHAHAEAHRAEVAEAREHRVELLLREAQRREQVAEHHELQVQSRAAQEINSLRSMLEQAQVQLQQSRAELQRSQTAALQATEVAAAMQEEAARTAAAQTARVQAQVSGEVQSAQSSVAQVEQLIQGLMNNSFPVATS